MRRSDVPRLYGIADRDALGGVELATAVAIFAEEGIRWIQIRAKGLPGEALRREAEACARALEGSGAVLWLDDRPDVAAMTPVAGVHLGQEDLPPRAARTVVGPDRWIGHSTHGLVQAGGAAAEDSVDVIAVGPILPTTGKQDPDPVVGTALLRTIRRWTEKPIVAIGGMRPGTLEEVLEAGADAVAVLGALCRGDLKNNARRLVAAAAAS